MEIFQLKQFMTIAQSGTMREAAERLHLSQPALSQNLKKLEAELGCDLFDRSHNQLRITPYGEILLERAHRIMFDLEEVRDEIERLKAREAATVRIGFFSNPFCVYLAPQIAAAFSDLRFEASIAQGGDGASGLLNHDFDLVVIPEGRCPKGFDSVRVLVERAALSVPVGYPVELGDEVALEDLARLQVLVPQEVGGLSGWYDSLLAASGIDPCNVIRLEEREYLAEMDTTELVHLTTSFMTDFLGGTSDRRAIPIAGERAMRPICMAWRPGNEKAHPIVEFVKSGGIRTVGGHAFLPYLLYPSNASNLVMAYGRP